ncbi:hypothetical protein MLD38_008748 [Melastoma candidum]|uniref:Uncharacterized protein n=1 Tax=Melastoma candidum TaxID=119954 RepID=A0ACB9RYD8_9MYRT|nr:hypothetical protein MLD38_008748 [Melastoma candidum]
MQTILDNGLEYSMKVKRTRDVERVSKKKWLMPSPPSICQGRSPLHFPNSYINCPPFSPNFTPLSKLNSSLQPLVSTHPPNMFCFRRGDMGPLRRREGSAMDDEHEEHRVGLRR